MKKKLVLIIAILFAVNSFAIDYYNTYPTHWWVGMKNPKLQLIMHGERVGEFTNVSIANPGVKIEKIINSLTIIIKVLRSLSLSKLTANEQGFMQVGY